MSVVRRLLLAISCLVLVALPAAALAAEKRIALVIGNAAYAEGPRATAANDAGLVAQTLQAAGFDVVGARDLDGDSIRRSLRDFLDKAAEAGPEGVAVVYLAGYGMQLEGQNYFLPVDARLARVSDLPVEGVRLSDYLHGLAGLGLKASVVIVDAARENPYLKSETSIAGGLALVDPESNQLIAFNAAPGTIAPPENGSYGAYAQALAEMLRQGGLSLPEVFAQVRLRVNDQTKGAQVPWNAGELAGRIELFERQPDAAPAPQAYQEEGTQTRRKPIGSFDARDAYIAAVDRDTFQGYLDFLAAYPDDPMAPRVRLILAARREALTWRRSWQADSPQGYWSYLHRYPRGPHAGDARRRLRELRAAFDPPPDYVEIEYDLPPPPPPEIVYIERPVFIFYDPIWRFPPPPPPPVIFIPPPVIVVEQPPPPPPEPYVLPVPVFTPISRDFAPPRGVVAPPDNVLFPLINKREPQQPGLTPGQAVGAAVAVGAAAALLKVALPPSVKKRAPPPGQPAALVPGQPPVPAKPLLPGQAIAPGPNPALQPLPGFKPKQDIKPVPGVVPAAPLPTPDNKLVAKPAPALEPAPQQPLTPQPLPGFKPKPGLKPVPGVAPVAPLPTPDNKLVPKTAPALQPVPQQPLTPQPLPGFKPKPALKPVPGAVPTAPLPTPDNKLVPKPAPVLKPLPLQVPKPAKPLKIEPQRPIVTAPAVQAPLVVKPKPPPLPALPRVQAAPAPKPPPPAIKAAPAIQMRPAAPPPGRPAEPAKRPPARACGGEGQPACK